MPRSSSEHSSGPSEPQSNISLGQAVSGYLSALSPEDRQNIATDLNAFVRWYGPQEELQSITPPDLDRYQEQLLESRTDQSNRLEALRGFLGYAKKQKLVATNLAIHVKIRRKKNSARASNGTGNGNGNGNSLQGDQIRLTREGYDKLAAELRFLETEMRPKIALELKTAAADKDFRENAPYDVAKNHQAEVESRIRELQNTLQTGQVVDVERSNIADLGSKVTLRDLLEDEEIIYTLVGPGEIDPRHGRISIQSPVGKALSGKTVGDEVQVEVPAGLLHLRVEKVEAR